MYTRQIRNTRQDIKITFTHLHPGQQEEFTALQILCTPSTDLSLSKIASHICPAHRSQSHLCTAVVEVIRCYCFHGPLLHISPKDSLDGFFLHLPNRSPFPVMTTIPPLPFSHLNSWIRLPTTSTMIDQLCYV
jgi:hypothetical protein